MALAPSLRRFATTPPTAPFAPELLLLCAAPLSTASPTIPAAILMPWALPFDTDGLCVCVPGLVVLWYEESMTLLVLWSHDPVGARKILTRPPQLDDLPLLPAILEGLEPLTTAMILRLRLDMTNAPSMSSPSTLSFQEMEVSGMGYAMHELRLLTRKRST